MSAYDDAVAYLDSEVHPRCDYDIYSDMRDIVDEMEDESEKLRALVLDFVNDLYSDATFEYPHTFLRRYAKRLKEVGIEVDGAPDKPMSDAARRVFDRLMSELDGDSDESR